jgi:phage shock protein C
MNERLYRSVDDRVLAGVCGGLAVRLDVDPSLVRIVYAVVALLSGIFPLLILYVIMAVVIPEEPTGFAGRPAAAPGPDAVPGWTPPDAGEAGWASPADAVAGEPGWTPPADAGAGAGWPPASDGTAVPPSSSPPAAPPPGTVPAQWAAQPSLSRHEARQEARRERREQRRSDPILALIGGLVLVGLGVWFLVRDRIDIDWGIVWAAGLVALGVVIILAAFRPRR